MGLIVLTLGDDFLEYLLVLIENGSKRSKMIEELEFFLGPRSEEFVNQYVFDSAHLTHED